MKAATPADQPAIRVRYHGPLTIAIMLATIMQVIDTTIANVALPHMQASLNATQDTISWVLTSYIVAAAIMTPVTGWLADRLGRKRLFIISVSGFTLMSVACGLATNLPEMVFFRLMQGLCGAALVPLSQAVLLDINPRERHGQAMAVWGAGIMVGPILGPTLGGWLTEVFDWRYVFFVNLPVGILALGGMLAFLPDDPPKPRRFDMFGFVMLTIAIGGLQLMLDRGQGEDWFNSVEIWIELGVTVAALWVFVTHSITHGEPFIDMAIFRDRNFAMGVTFMFIIGMILLSGLALLPPMLQHLMGYPVITTGWVMAPRGVGTMITMLLVGRLVKQVDARLLVLTGLSLTAWSLHMMTQFTADMGQWPLISSGIIQGLGFGLVFIPLTTLAYATLDQKYRTDAASLFNLVRNIGSSIGISIVMTALVQLGQINHAELGAHITAFSPAVNMQMPALLSGDPLTLSMVDNMVTGQALMISYINDFKLMMFITLAAMPIVLFLKPPKRAAMPVGSVGLGRPPSTRPGGGQANASAMAD
ncbi:MAG: DHA2 family efflux MFS transporter permease subunit [Nitratireductor sp.]|nr:DHA2 family efflux MFS transporter permease subunit [Nitratireductor sp.]